MSENKKRILVPVEYSGNLEDNQIGYYVGSMVDVHINGVLELNSPSDWIDARPSLIEQIKECLEDNYEGLFDPTDKYVQQNCENYRTLEETFHAYTVDANGYGIRACDVEHDIATTKTPDYVSGIMIIEIECPPVLVDHLETTTNSPWLYGLRY